MKQLSIFSAQKSMSSQILCCASEGSINIPESNEAWKKRIQGVKAEKSCRDYDGINGEPTEFEWNIFAGFDALQLCDSQRFTEQIRRKTGIFHRKNRTLCRCSTTFPVEQKAIKKNVWQMPESSPYLQRSLVLDNGHLLVPVPKKKWYSMKEDSPQGSWDSIAEKMLVEFAERGCPIFRATTPLSRCQLRSKGHGELSIHFAATQETIETFRTIVSANQLSLYGAVAENCDLLR